MDDPPIVDYRPPQPHSSGRGWIYASLIGVAGGAFFGVFLHGLIFIYLVIPFGFMIGAASALPPIRRIHKFKCGLFGVCLCVITVTAMVTISNWRAGFPPSPMDLFYKLCWIVGLVGIPGLCGTGMMVAIAEPFAPRL